MAKYLLTGDGRRLLTGGGQPLMADAPGAAYSELETVPATISVSGSASPAAIVALSAAAALISLTGTAEASTTATAMLEPASITISGTAEPFTASSAAGTIRITGSAQVSPVASIEPAPATIHLTGAATPVGVRTVEVDPATIRLTGSAVGGHLLAPLTAHPAVIRVTGSAQPSVSFGGKFRSYWLAAYDTRQEVLNAIDAANRLLAKTAGEKADANAEAIIVTNAAVEVIGGRVVAESERTTLLTATVGDLSSELVQTQQAMSDGDDALAAQITQTNLALGGKVDVSALAAQILRIDQQDDTLTLHSGQIAATEASLADKADTSAMQLLEGRIVETEDGVVVNSAAITQVKASTGQSPGNLVLHGQFEDGSIGSWTGGEVFIATNGNMPIRVQPSEGNIHEYPGGEYNWIPANEGDVFDIYAAGILTANAGLLFYSERDLSSSLGIGTGRLYGTSAPASITTAAPEGSKWALTYIRAYSSDPAYVRGFRITKQTPTEARLASVTESMRADVDGVTGKVNASYTIALNANDYHSGVIAQNNGSWSSWRFVSDFFAVYNTSGAGLSWTDGNLWNTKGTYSLITGPDLGEDMIFYIGSTPISPQQARKADAIMWVDRHKNAYFAGQVLQGVLRAFNSSTTVSSSASVSTGSISSNNKSVALTGRFQYQYVQTYPSFGSTITLGSGSTSATVVLERRYGSGSWTELDRMILDGNDAVINESDGPSMLRQSINGQFFATDVADTRDREYRTRVLSIARRSHSVSGHSGSTPAAVQSQYQSIESME